MANTKNKFSINEKVLYRAIDINTNKIKHRLGHIVQITLSKENEIVYKIKFEPRLFVRPKDLNPLKTGTHTVHIYQTINESLLKRSL